MPMKIAELPSHGAAAPHRPLQDEQPGKAPVDRQVQNQ